MFKWLRILFHRHRWEMTDSGRATAELYGVGDVRCAWQLQECSHPGCNRIRGTITTGYGTEIVPAAYIETMLAEPE